MEFDFRARGIKNSPGNFRSPGEKLFCFQYFCQLNSSGSKNFTGTAFPRCFPGVQSGIFETT